MPGITNPPAIPTLTVGGRVFTDLENLVVLVTSCTTPSGPRGTFRKANATSGYQVPASKKFVIHAVKCVGVAATANVICLGYGDTDVGFSAASPPTNPVYFGGDAANGAVGQAAMGTSINESGAKFEIPANKYGFVNFAYASANCNVLVYGYEVPA